MKSLVCSFLFSLTMLLSFSGCAPKGSSDIPVTQLQMREIQTRNFDTDDTKLVMKSMMNVLQDDGYILKNVVLDLGLLSAERNIDTENTGVALLQTLLVGQGARWEKHQVMEASANVSSFGEKTRVRMTFQTKTIDNFNCPKNVTTVTDMKTYQEFFDKVSKSIFLQSEEI